MTTLNKFRFLVEGNSEYIYNWYETLPTTYDNKNIIENSVTVLETITNEIPKIKIEKENIQTGGHFQSWNIDIDCVANSKSTKDISWNMPISLFSSQINFPIECIGDEIEAIVAPDTIVGVLSQSLSNNSNVVYINPSSINNVFIGATLTISDEENSDNLGEIININYETNAITLEKNSEHSFLTNSIIKINIFIVKKSKIVNSGNIVVGQADIAGQYFPAGRILRINYYNNSETVNKKLNLFLEYLY